MHTRGYCHRDLKPENCVIETATMTLKVRARLVPSFVCRTETCHLVTLHHELYVGSRNTLRIVILCRRSSTSVSASTLRALQRWGSARQ